MTTPAPTDTDAPAPTTAEAARAFMDPGDERSPVHELAVAVRHLSHTYPDQKPARRKQKHAPPDIERAALDNVSLSVRAGEVFGLLGPNGSGKSTLFRILATVQQAAPPPDATPASASVFGTDLDTDPAGIRQQIGVVFQHPSIDDKLTARENLRYHGMLHGLTGAALRDRCAAMLQSVELHDRADDRAEAFSGGMRRRLEIAKALLPAPRLLLMDEASAGLDPAATRSLWRTLRREVDERGLTVLLTTHLMHEAEHCDRLAVLAEGRVVAVDTPAGLVDRVGGQVLEVGFRGDGGESSESLARQVAERLGVALDGPETGLIGGVLRVELPDAASAVPGVAELLGEQAGSIRVARPTLEDAYLKLAGSRLSG